MKKFARKITAFVIAVAMVFASTASVHASSNNRTDVPLRATLESVDAYVDWVDGSAVITMPNGDEWVFIPGAATATLNSQEVALMYPVTMAGGVMFISYADVVALFGTAQVQEAGLDMPFAATIETALSAAPAFMNMVGVTGLTMAVVDIETGFTWTQGFGYADSVNGIQVDEHTLFQVGSTSKPFTAIAVMQLVEEGLIDLDSPLVNYLPEFSMLPSPVLGGSSDDVTVRMLLNNTSGVISNNFKGMIVTGDEQYQGHMNNLLEWLPTRELLFVPGDMYDYSNNNWTLLSILVARVMGFDNYFEGFVEHTDATIFAPLGMERTTFEFTPALTNVAMPYVTLNRQDDMHTVSSIGAGGLLSSAYEMARFMHAIGGDGTLDGQRLLRQETIAYMMQEHSVMIPGMMEYGLGFFRISIDGLETVGHGGNITHYHTEMIIHLETGIGVFVSTNTISGITITTALAYTVMDAAITEKTGVSPLPPLPTQPELPAGEGAMLSEEELIALAAFEGIYSFGEAGVWELEIVDGVLTWRSGDIMFELTPLPDGTFDSLAGIYSFEFVDGVAIATLTAGDTQVPGIRLDDSYEIEVPEEIMAWVGVYNFVPQVENEAGIITQVIISVNEHGLPLMTMIQPIHAYFDAPEIPLGEYNGYYFAATMPVRFLVDDDGNKTIDLMGALFAR